MSFFRLTKYNYIFKYDGEYKNVKKWYLKKNAFGGNIIVYKKNIMFMHSSLKKNKKTKKKRTYLYSKILLNLKKNGEYRKEKENQLDKIWIKINFVGIIVHYKDWIILYICCLKT